MSDMHFEERMITSAVDGAQVVAGFLICLDCESDTFHIFTLGPAQTTHMQCANCGTSYCTGGCCGQEPLDATP